MRPHPIPLLLLTACCLAWQPSLAQRVAPIVPRMALVQPAAATRQGVAVPAAASQSASSFKPAVADQWPAPQPDPLYILNSRLVIDNSFRGIKPNDIAKLEVYKGPGAPLKWRSLTTNGIISITLKKKSKAKIKARTLAEIGKWLQVSGPVSYSINGMPVGDADLRIATVAIGEVKVTRAAPTAPTTLVNIQIAHHTPPPPAPDPSGKPRIMIRGTASL